MRGFLSLVVILLSFLFNVDKDSYDFYHMIPPSCKLNNKFPFLAKFNNILIVFIKTWQASFIIPDCFNKNKHYEAKSK